MYLAYVHTYTTKDVTVGTIFISMNVGRKYSFAGTSSPIDSPVVPCLTVVCLLWLSRLTVDLRCMLGTLLRAYDDLKVDRSRLRLCRAAPALLLDGSLVGVFLRRIVTVVRYVLV